MNNNTFSIKIEDSSGKHVGQLMTASLSDIISLMDKGMTIIDTNTNTPFTREGIYSMMGVSDGVMVV